MIAFPAPQGANLRIDPASTREKESHETRTKLFVLSVPWRHLVIVAFIRAFSYYEQDTPSGVEISGSDEISICGRGKTENRTLSNCGI